MSNKTILQNYNSRLSTNYSDLNSILETINNLPSGGEDFTSELNVYEGYLNTQETTIADLINALQGKAIQNFEDWILTYEDGTTETIKVGVA